MSKRRHSSPKRNDFESSDSDEDYTENEKVLLANIHKKKKYDSDSEEEVLSVGGNEDSDENQSDLALSDVEESREDDDLPDIRAWGKNKKVFYNTDYVDPGFGDVQGKNAQLAELEEQDATNLQQLLTHQLDDFVEILSKRAGTGPIEDTSENDSCKTSKIQDKESPEFYGFLEEFKDHFSIAKELAPLVENYKQGRLTDSSLVDFILTQHKIILLYCTNICTYLLLKSSQVNIQNHPILKRLFQFHQILSKMMPTYNEVKPQIHTLLQSAENHKSSPGKHKKKKTLSILSHLNDKTTHKMKRETDKLQSNGKEKISITKNHQREAEEDKNDSICNETINKTDEIEDLEPQSENGYENGKRGLTYQMLKNKGLTPYRKKEQRNPRVKHRNKYRKATIRRKGAVREYRSEPVRYSGEISGIKKCVTKSIKIKT